MNKKRYVFHVKVEQLERRAKNAESLPSKWQQQITELWYAVRKLGYKDFGDIVDAGQPDSELSRTKRALEYAKRGLQCIKGYHCGDGFFGYTPEGYAGHILARIRRIEEGKQEVSDGLTK